MNTHDSSTGSAGLRILIFLYAFGIIAIALQPFRGYWAPYLFEIRSAFYQLTEWGDPPKRTTTVGASTVQESLLPLPAASSPDTKSAPVKIDPKAAKAPPMEEVKSEDKKALQVLLNGMAK